MAEVTNIGNWVKFCCEVPIKRQAYFVKRSRNIEDAACNATEWQKSVLAEWCKTRIYKSTAVWNGRDWIDDSTGATITEFVVEWFKV